MAFNLFDRFFKWLHGAYERKLQLVLRHRGVTMLFSLAILVATAVLFVVIPKGFFPDEDTGRISVTTEASQDISFDAMRAHQLVAMKIAQDDTNVDNSLSFIGGGNNGRLFLGLKDLSQRKLNAFQVIQEMRPKFAQVPGINVYMQSPPLIRVGGMASKGLYQYSLQDTDVQELFREAPKLMDRLSQQPEYFQDVTSDLLIATPQVIVEIDRDKAAALGVTVQQIENTLNEAYGEIQTSTIYADVAEYQVIFEVEPQFQREPAALSQLYIASSITGPNGNPNLIPLNTVAKLTRNLGPTSISHIGQLPAVTLSFNLPPGVSLGTAVAQVQKTEADMHLPATITGSFQGAAAVFQSSQAGLFALLAISIIIIYIILGILYESFIHPITILSGLPSAGFGALITLMLFHLDLNIYGFVGLIMLIGIVKKNAILMIDFAITAQREHGKNAEEAIHEGCLLRFRPIMMTTMAALCATFPIALGLGAGGESRQSLGLAVVGGLLVSQCLTLFITPVIYLYLEAAHQWYLRKHARRAALQAGTRPVAG